MSRFWRRALVAVGIIVLAVYFTRGVWSEAASEVGVWPATLLIGGLVLVIAGSIAFDFWFWRGLIRWVRGDRE